MPIDLTGEEYTAFHDISISHLVELEVICYDAVVDVLRLPYKVLITGSKSTIRAAKDRIYATGRSRCCFLLVYIVWHKFWCTFKNSTECF